MHPRCPPASRASAACCSGPTRPPTRAPPTRRPVRRPAPRLALAPRRDQSGRGGVPWPRPERCGAAAPNLGLSPYSLCSSRRQRYQPGIACAMWSTPAAARAAGRPAGHCRPQTRRRRRGPSWPAPPCRPRRLTDVPRHRRDVPRHRNDVPRRWSGPAQL